MLSVKGCADGSKPLSTGVKLTEGYFPRLFLTPRNALQKPIGVFSRAGFFYIYTKIILTLITHYSLNNVGIIT